MLSKLMKYELKATGRIMLPLFLILFAATVALGANMHFTSDSTTTVSFIISLILVILFVASILMVTVITALLIMYRFYKNLLGDEGYLMFSLPVSAAQNIISKGLTALIWIIGAILTGGICGITMVAIAGDLSDFLSNVKDFWELYLTFYGNGKAVFYLILLILTIILSMLEAIFKVYASIAVGHQWGNHRIIGSVLAYIGFSVIETVLSSLINLSELRLLFRTEIPSSEATLAGYALPIEFPEFAPILLIAVIGLLIYGLITWILLDRRLNLE